MKYILQRNGKKFFESNSFAELDSTFTRLIGKLTIIYMKETQLLNGKKYDSFQCADGYSLFIRK